MSDEQQAETADESVDAEESDEQETAADAETEGIQTGDFVRLDYTVRTKGEDGQVVDTTRKEVAEEAGIDDDEYEFSPRIVVVGEGHVFEAVDDELVGKSAGDAGTVEIPPAEAFGEFDPEQVRTVSADKVPEDDRYPGAQVQIDGQQGHLETIIGGRARVDFNHPLAGETLEYDYEVLDVVEDREERATGLLGMYLQQAPEVWIQTDEVDEEVEVEVDSDEEDADSETATETETVEKETLYIEATPQMTMNQQWLFSKQQIAQDLMQKLDLDRVIVQETIEGMGGMGGMMGGMGGMGGMAPEDIEEAVDDIDLEEDLDVDADEIVDELDEE
jgi:FKBP-type peptidyl-prolyl cis-trans isomerase SlyD